jgi:hypothetical protein
MPTVDWSESRIQQFRDGVIDVITTATAGDYQLSNTWENLHTPSVVMVGAGWAPQAALGVLYRMDVYTLYSSQDANPEAGSEEMMRRVYCALAYSTSEDEHVDLGEVTAVDITLGETDNAVRYAGHLVQINASLDLTPPTEDDD